MDTTWNGKKVKRICFNRTDGDESIMTIPASTLELEARYHGDRDEFWIKRLDYVTGREISRYNCKYIASIEWL